MKQEVILVLDCGATNVRAIAVNRQGKIVARASTPNASDIAMENNTWHQCSIRSLAGNVREQQRLWTILNS